MIKVSFTSSKCPARLVMLTTLAPGRNIGLRAFATYQIKINSMDQETKSLR